MKLDMIWEIFAFSVLLSLNVYDAGSGVTFLLVNVLPTLFQTALCASSSVMKSFYKIVPVVSLADAMKRFVSNIQRCDFKVTCRLIHSFVQRVAAVCGY